MSGSRLDTGIVLWTLREPRRLSGAVTRIIAEASGLHIGAASRQEIGTKRQAAS